MSKLISVIMGIYNCADTLPEAIDSILRQTYTDWELILCDDCSVDTTAEVAQQFINKYPDKIHLLRNTQNMGLNFTLNKCLKEAQGDYIARMDGDDICAPERFAREVDALEENPEIAIVSTDMNFYDANGIWGKTHTKERPKPADFLKETQFCHAACMVRKEAYEAVNGYSVETKLLRVEDYHLWIKMYAKGYRGLNIQEPLYSMRDDRNAQSRKKFKYRLNEAYVKAYAIKHLNLPFYGYIYCLKPILIGLLPSTLFNYLHKVTKTKVVPKENNL